jgi:hypothetical protein
MPVQKKELKNCNRRVCKRRGRKYFEVAKVFSLFCWQNGYKFIGWAESIVVSGKKLFTPSGHESLG